HAHRPRRGWRTNPWTLLTDAVTSVPDQTSQVLLNDVPYSCCQEGIRLSQYLLLRASVCQVAAPRTSAPPASQSDFPLSRDGLSRSAGSVLRAGSLVLPRAGGATAWRECVNPGTDSRIVRISRCRHFASAAEKPATTAP